MSPDRRGMKVEQEGQHPVQDALPVLYQDEACAAVGKPSGLLVHPNPRARERDSVVRRLARQFGRKVYNVHRLDRATSGVLLVAFDPPSAHRMCQAFRFGEVEKRYHAVVRGYTDPVGRIERPLRDWEGTEIREAVTEYRTLATAELPIPVGPYQTARYSLVEVRPLTGRTHQIRRHLSGIAHPVVGDTTHGDAKHNRMFRERFGIHRLLLHATELAFTSPATGERVRVRAPLDDAWRRALEVLGWTAFLD